MSTVSVGAPLTKEKFKAEIEVQKAADGHQVVRESTGTNSKLIHVREPSTMPYGNLTINEWRTLKNKDLLLQPMNI